MVTGQMPYQDSTCPVYGVNQELTKENDGGTRPSLDCAVTLREGPPSKERPLLVACVFYGLSDVDPTSFLVVLPGSSNAVKNPSFNSR